MNKKQQANVTISNTLPQIILGIGAVVLAFLFLALPFYVLFTAQPVYYELQEELGVFSALGEEKVKLIDDNVISFFKGDAPLLYFDEAETAHMVDVKNLYYEGIGLFWWGVALLVITITLFYLLSRLDARHQFKKNMSSLLLYGSGVGIAILLVLFIASLNFSWLFGQFHALFFPQGNYTFMSDSLFIRVYPALFFFGFAKIAGGFSAALCFFGLGTGLLLRRKK